MEKTSTKTVKEESELLRSQVRPHVTYLVITIYTFTTAFAVMLLLFNSQYSEALALLSGLSAVATGIVGFWFGSRGKGGIPKPGADDFIASAEKSADNTLSNVKSALLKIKRTMGELAVAMGKPTAGELIKLLENPGKLNDMEKKKIASFLETDLAKIFT